MHGFKAMMQVASPHGLRFLSMMQAWLVALLLMLGLMSQPALAQIPGLPVTGTGQTLRGSAAVVKPRLVWSTTQIRPGGQGALAIVIDIDDHFHINPNAQQIPKELSNLIPLTIDLTGLPAGVIVGQPQFPKAGQVKFGTDTLVPGYEKRAVIYLPVMIDPSYAGDAISFDVEVGYQSCNDSICLPPASTTLHATLPVVSGQAGGSDLAAIPPPEDVTELFRGFDASVFANLTPAVSTSSDVTFDLFGWELSFSDASAVGLAMILLMAMIGGLLLNFTPCVLPVIPIKILSLKQAAGGAGRQVRLGIAMSLGVVAFWLGLGLAMVISARLAAAAVDGATAGGFSSTNQLFQNPWFTIIVGVVIIVMAVGMCGLFTIRLPQWVYRINPGHDSYHGSFGFGVMTAILSTPCTAPFMGAAAAWAVGQNPAMTLSVFMAIGFGMALPYLILSMNPKWVDRMPRTGPASELIKQVMGLLLLAAGVFFLGTGLSGLLVDPPQPPSRDYWWGVALMVALAGFWLIWRIIRIGKSPVTKGVFSTIGAVMIVVAIAGAINFTDKGPIHWTYYTPQQVEQAKANGKVVVLEFTAEWCLNCKLLEQSVLATKEVSSLLNSGEVAAIKVDLTGNNELGNQLLNQLDRVAIPLLVVMAPDGREVFKSDFYTKEQVIDAVARAQAGSAASSK